MNKWISVKDKSPNYINETILLSDGYEVFPGFFSSNHEYMINAEEICEEYNFYPTHWMPLPEPPK